MAGSAELAIDKAFTAHIFNNRTDALGALAQPGAELYGIQHSHWRKGRWSWRGHSHPLRRADDRRNWRERWDRR